MEIVFESIGCFVPHKIPKKKSGSGILHHGGERLIFNVRRSSNRKKLREHLQAYLKRHSRQLLAAKRKKKRTGGIYTASITKRR